MYSRALNSVKYTIWIRKTKKNIKVKRGEHIIFRHLSVVITFGTSETEQKCRLFQRLYGRVVEWVDTDSEIKSWMMEQC